MTKHLQLSSRSRMVELHLHSLMELRVIKYRDNICLIFTGRCYFSQNDYSFICSNRFSIILFIYLLMSVSCTPEYRSKKHSLVPCVADNRIANNLARLQPAFLDRFIDNFSVKLLMKPTNRQSVLKCKLDLNHMTSHILLVEFTRKLCNIPASVQVTLCDF
jgi:hypothetical protein